MIELRIVQRAGVIERNSEWCGATARITGVRFCRGKRIKGNRFPQIHIPDPIREAKGPALCRLTLKIWGDVQCETKAATLLNAHGSALSHDQFVQGRHSTG